MCVMITKEKVIHSVVLAHVKNMQTKCASSLYR